MRYLKYFSILIFSMLLVTSCFEDGPNLEDNALGNNVAGFANASQVCAGIADGVSTYTFKLKVKVTGPTMMDLTEDVTMTFGANDASTAISGTHYSITNSSVTLSAANNYLGEVEFTMLTAGIEAPLDESPVLVLEVTDATGPSNVVNSGKLMNVTLNYACFSNLAGTYDVETLRGDGGLRYWTETIKEIGIGTYLTQYVGTWDPPLNSSGYGFVFNDVCDVLTIPDQDLADMYSNDVRMLEAGTVDDETGVLEMSYTIEFSDGPFSYESTYTPAK